MASALMDTRIMGVFLFIFLFFLLTPLRFAQ
jgi:hypothetical protein